MLRRVLVMAALAAGCVGCASPRLVRVDKDGGVVAIPSNTNVWPTYYRDKAEAMLRQKCPGGYEIVREEEVVTGRVEHTDTRTQTEQNPTLLVGGTDGETTRGSRSTRSSDSFGAMAIPLGPTEQKTQQTTQSQDVTEWRITYRAKPPAGG